MGDSLFETISQAEFDRLGGSKDVIQSPPKPSATPQQFEIDHQMQICSSCGCCEEPDNCVYGVQCPECYAPPTQQCTNPNGGLTGIHEARHKTANSPWWKEYREKTN